MKKILIALSCIILLAIASFIYRGFSIANLAARESAQRALFKEAKTLLQEHHDAYGKYPDRLTALSFTYPDGGDESILNDFDYSADKSGCRLRILTYRSQRVLEFELKAQQAHER